MNDESQTTDMIQKKSSAPGKVVLGITLPLVLVINGLDMVIPPAGIPLAVLAIWLILRRTGVGWAHIGLERPESWRRTIALGVGLGIGLQLAATFGLEPILRFFTGEEPDLSRFDAMKGNVSTLALYLTISWTTAGFGEEIIWRGWTMTGVARLLGEGKVAWVVSLLVSSVLFGFLHLYQGPAGMLSTGLVGLSFGIVYLATGRNLWIPILCHAIMNSISFVLLFLGIHL
jgi:membrane protease YdiL (CAAX protease family)